jgi:hypothetical protein
VAVGEWGTVVTSTNGQDWVLRSTARSDYLWAVGTNEFGFLAVGQRGLILTSRDGATWVPSESGVSQWLNGIASGAETTVVAGDAGVILNPAPPEGDEIVLWDPAVGDAGFQFPVTGLAVGRPLTVEVSENLDDWFVLTNLVTGPPPVVVADAAWTNAALRFYRVRTP